MTARIGGLPRRFVLQRDRDVSGVSGTGAVAFGVMFPDRTVVIRWRGQHCSTVVWADIDSALAVHGHDGATRVDWIDPPGSAESTTRDRTV